MADQLSDEEISDLKEAFGLFDVSGDGTVDRIDLPALLASLGHSLRDEERRELLMMPATTEASLSAGQEDEATAAEEDEAATSLDFPEFLTLVAERQRRALASEAELHDAFRVFDKVQWY